MSPFDLMMRNAGYAKASANLDNGDIVTPADLAITKTFLWQVWYSKVHHDFISESNVAERILLDECVHTNFEHTFVFGRLQIFEIMHLNTHWDVWGHNTR